MTIRISVESINSLNDWKKVFGVDCVIFVSLMNSQQNFANIMKQIDKMKRNVGSKYSAFMGAFTFFKVSE